MSQQYRVLSGHYRPRQFEYHPKGDRILFGTLSGELCEVRLGQGGGGEHEMQQEDPIRYFGNYGDGTKSDAVLGICWLRKHTDMFCVGSSNGRLSCGTSAATESSPQPPPPPTVAATATATASFAGTPPPSPHTSPRRARLNHPSIVKSYAEFPMLTSVHINSNDDFLLVSGYTQNARVYDLESGQKLADYQDIHNGHINISRFCNHSPFVFATSSFDTTAKLWDLRVPKRTMPIYTCQCGSGLVMINFSADDTFLLASCLDNEINQFLTVDGRKDTSYSVPKTGLRGNFTRAYYSSSGAYVVTGACEEQNVRMLCSASGQVLSTTDVYPQKKHSSLYVQSLRGDPKRDASFSVLCNYRDITQREIVQVELAKPESLSESGLDARKSKGEAGLKLQAPAPTDAVDEEEENVRVMPSPALSQMMLSMRREALSVSVHFSPEGELCVDEEAAGVANADVVLIGTAKAEVVGSEAKQQQVFGVAAHAFVLGARCPILRSLVDDALHAAAASAAVGRASGEEGEGGTGERLAYVRITSVIPEISENLFSLVLDYLYAGDVALDLPMVRLSCLKCLDGEMEEGLKLLQLEALSKDEAFWRAPLWSQFIIDKIEELLLAGFSLGLDSLVVRAEGLLTRCVLPHTCLHVLAIVERQGRLRLRARVLHFLASHLYIVQASFPEAFCRDQDGSPTPLLEEVLALRRSWSVPAVKIPAQAEALSPGEYRLLKSNGSTSSSKSTVEVVASSSRASGAGVASSPMDADADGADLTEAELSELATLVDAGFGGGGGGGGGEDDDDGEAEEEDDEEEDLINAAPYEEEDMQSWLWKQPGSSSPARWTSELPRFCGHCFVEARGLSLVIGGRDRYRYHCLRHLPAYHVASKTWSFLSVGDATSSSCGEEISLPSRMHLTAAGVEHASHARHVITIGGSYHHGERVNDTKVDSGVLLLDVHTLTWSSPPVTVITPSSRSSAAGSGNEGPLQNRYRHCSATIYRKADVSKCGTDIANSASASASAVASEEEDVVMKLSGGIDTEKPRLDSEEVFAALLRHGLNQQRRSLSSASTSHSPCSPSSSYSPAASSSSLPVSWTFVFGGLSERRIVSETSVLVASLPGGKEGATPEFTYVVPVIKGQGPSARFQHSACAVPLPANLGGSRIFIFGGMDREHYLGDLYSLRCGSMGEADSSIDWVSWDLEWDRLEVHGSWPQPHHAHTMTLLPDPTSSASHPILVMLGGIGALNTPTPLNEVHLLHVEELRSPKSRPTHGNSSIRVRWERILVDNTATIPRPPSRSLHSALPAPSNGPLSMIIFGGAKGNSMSIENRDSNSNASEVFSLRFYKDKKAGAYRAAWLEDVVEQAQVELRPEPVVTPLVESLHNDLLKLLLTAQHEPQHEQQQEQQQEEAPADMDTSDSGTGAFSRSSSGGCISPSMRGDVSFDLSNDLAKRGAATGDEILHAHKALVSRRCDIIQAMCAWSSETGRSVLNMGPLLDDQLEPAEKHRLFASLLQFLYSDTLVCGNDDITGLLALANQFSMQRLSQLCEGFLCREVTLENCGSLLQYADWYSLDTLKAVCFATMIREWKKLSFSSGEGGGGGGSGGDEMQMATEEDGGSGLIDLGLGSDLSSLSAELLAEVNLYRMTQRHVNLMDHEDNEVSKEMRKKGTNDESDAATDAFEAWYLAKKLSSTPDK